MNDTVCFLYLVDIAIIVGFFFIVSRFFGSKKCKCNCNENPENKSPETKEKNNA